MGNKQGPNVSIGFQADTAKFVKNVGAGKNSLKELRDDVKKTRSSLDDLKDAFGKNSALGKTLKIAAGGGAIAGLTMAAKSVGEIGDKLAEVRKMSADGAGT